MAVTAAVADFRWDRAQASELTYWRGMSVGELLRICAEKPMFLDQVGDARTAALFDGKDVLEIGCGPLGISIASFYRDKAKIRRLVKAEPLARVELEELAAPWPQWVRPFVAWAAQIAREGEYVQRAGEQLGFDQTFDTVVTYNVIDHVKDPLGVLRTGYSALRPGGAILVAVDCFSVLGRLKFDGYTRRAKRGSILVEAHPHSFLPRHVEALMREAGFRQVECLSRRSLARHVLGNAYRPFFIGYRGP